MLFGCVGRVFQKPEIVSRHDNSNFRWRWLVVGLVGWIGVWCRLGVGCGVHSVFACCMQWSSDGIVFVRCSLLKQWWLCGVFEG